MVPSGAFRKTFLIVTGSSGIFVLIFMVISTQYLTLTTNTLYRDIRAQLLTLGNYTVSEPVIPTELSRAIDVTTTEKPNTTPVPVIRNRSVVLTTIPARNVEENELPKFTPNILMIRNRTRVLRTPILVRRYESCFNFSIDKPDVCHPEQKVPLLLIVVSGVTHRSARNAVRATWGGYASELGIPIFFLLGRTLSEIEQRNVEREDELFEDIVQENCIDTYRNMTLKTVSLMKWVATYCNHVPFVLKTDDDMVVNIDRLLQFLNTLNSTQPSIYGRLARRWRPHRVRYSKWYVSRSDYRGTYYPDFTTGPAYLFTTVAASKLYQKSLDTSFLFLEDVFMTGIVAQKVGVKRIHNRQFHNSSSTLVYKAFGMIITSHGHSPSDIRHIWYRHNVYAGETNRNVFKANH